MTPLAASSAIDWAVVALVSITADERETKTPHNGDPLFQFISVASHRTAVAVGSRKEHKPRRGFVSVERFESLYSTPHSRSRSLHRQALHCQAAENGLFWLGAYRQIRNTLRTSTDLLSSTNFLICYSLPIWYRYTSFICFIQTN